MHLKHKHTDKDVLQTQDCVCAPCLICTFIRASCILIIVHVTER
jgi:hypothetical protein